MGCWTHPGSEPEVEETWAYHIVHAYARTHIPPLSPQACAAMEVTMELWVALVDGRVAPKR